jgi:hypothetical protein
MRILVERIVKKYGHVLPFEYSSSHDQHCRGYGDWQQSPYVCRSWPHRWVRRGGQWTPIPRLRGQICARRTTPGATPRPIVDKLAAAFRKTQEDKALVKRLADLGYVLNVVGPTEFAKIIAKEREEYGRIAAGGRLDRPN